MASEADLQATLDNLGTAVTAEIARGLAAIQAAVAAAGPVSQAQLDALNAEGQTIIANVTAAFPPPAA